MERAKHTQQLIDSLSMGICIIDPVYKVLYWNEYMHEYTGIPSGTICCKPLGDFFPSFKLEVYTERINSVFEGWPPVVLSSRFHHLFIESPNGKLKNKSQDVTISALVSSEEGAFNALISVIDVTESNRQLEELNMQYKKAKQDIEIRERIQSKLMDSEIRYRELNNMKDKLISIIAHDLRSPFTSLIGYMEILANEPHKISQNRQQEIIAMLLDGTRQTYALLENLLLWANMQIKGGVMYRPVAFNLEAVLTEVVAKMKHMAQRKEISIVIECKEVADVFADVDMVQAILRNIISNAIKYTHPKGRIQINSAKENDSYAFVSIKDDGVGMNPETIANLFKMEKSVSAFGTDNEKGTGLGLLVCKEFIDKNKGKLEIISSLGSGSEFKFTLPLRSL
ncbi:MAG TPA: hypothetical protein DCQ26_05520 [Marinilabiliales bacterium]|jgi:signal transduction histidine kinase|nr:MAG: hypothetical protein A2W95_05670 [Bacteroidetes bacterium GWA2_40_14]OFX57857.1 MAG: hypothetical protein A2W84_16525 [Bacteroidetes bacterium GWC2_40_13]OFX73982.1 MAG: hypothetical protein A2W96_11750 [Bacteroidetes bacterium GWD2_40_43]OFX93184.1 MAG: hypothetical protein A2W97_06320 [Bacteroidetes bacterium GWE2_40_63]OFY21554.1 MAG: hypothetical protein A2W88_10320 [Bacteroidetes bacterium GWF2_40_13]HAM98049.1 hypothetical protein [Marinilabiliales bacterium]